MRYGSRYLFLMVNTQNSQLIEELKNVSKLNAAFGIPTQLNNSIVPVVEINPKQVKDAQIAAVSTAATGASTIIANTAFTNRDLRIYSVSMAVATNAACDMGTGAVNVTAIIGGASKVLLSLPTITLTAQNTTMSVSFPRGILIDKASTVSMSGTFGAGICVRTAQISYVVDECSNGS